MDARALRCLLAAAALAASLPAGAEVALESTQPCQLPASDVDPMRDRAGILAQYERLPQSCLQRIFNDCSEASRSTLLDFGSAAVCSFGYEALLRQHFGGSFRALMAWWRTQRDSLH